MGGKWRKQEKKEACIRKVKTTNAEYGEEREGGTTT